MGDNEIKNGREPIRNKVYEGLLETSATERNKLALTATQKAYLKNNDLVSRFILKKEYLKANNFHRTGWKVVADQSMPGSNAEGLVEVGDLVLAVKTTSAQTAHRGELKRKAERHSDSKSVNKRAAQELRAAMQESNLNGRIHEGYEENGGAEEDED